MAVSRTFVLRIAALMAGLGLVPFAPAAAQCPPGRVFGTHAPYAVGAGPYAVLLEDLNEDGIADLVTGGAIGSGMLTVRLGRGGGGVGDGSFDPPVTYPAGAQLSGLVAGDFDEDGILDVAAGDYVGQRVVVLLGKGDAGVGNGTFAAPAFYAQGRRPRCIASGDFDEDGITDLVIGDEVNPGSVVVLRGLGAGGVGDGGFAAPVLYPLGGTPQGIVVADFDEDGIADVAVAQPSGVSILRGAGAGGVGNGTFLPPVLEPMAVSAHSILAADFDEDDITDLATANHGGGAGSIRVLLGRGADGHGDGTFDPEAIYPASNGALAIVSADWDADGILDLAVANASIDSITVLLGQGIDDVGNGTFAELTRSHAAGYPIALATADLNADARPDLVVAQFSSNEARVFLGDCAPHTGIGPRIVAVRDAPADQGGSVFVAWERSPYDGVLSTIVRSYSVSRRDDPTGPWQTLATLPAQRLAGYGYLAATARDSMPNDNPLTAFRVTANTLDPEMAFESKSDSGYSVDNLAPPPPDDFVAAYGAGVILRWGASAAADHGAFRLHRGTSDDFVPAAENQIAELNETAYVDATGTESDRYKLVAVDRHGNASAASLATRSDVVPSPRLALAITRVAPNPSRDGRVSIAFTRPAAGPAVHELIDARGRVAFARTLDGGGEGVVVVPGERALLAPGVYVVRLSENGRAVRAKAVVLR